ncbi:DUF4097 family beta strand repeat-containing protein [Streptomyces sp. NPDC048172]|uniref:DUF4097 family beta strand repeat-containing protein n=1 Tax=Streptomyces sp. NPDC048172 TaxID=3365505 RepID=UPI00371F3DF3
MTKRTAAACALAVTVCAVGALSACSTEEVSDGKAEHREFALSGKRLTVVSDDSKLELVPVKGENKGVDVTRWFKASKVKGEAKVSWSMEGGKTLRLKTKCTGFIVDCNTRHKVKVPEDVAVTVKTGAGRVVASGFRTPLSVRTKDGNVNVRDLTGPLTLSTVDGNVRAERLRSPSVTATARDGYQLLSFAKAPSSVRTDVRDGRTTVTVPKKQTYKVTTKVSDGTAKVTVPRDAKAPRSIHATAHDGRVAVRGR